MGVVGLVPWEATTEKVVSIGVEAPEADVRAFMDARWERARDAGDTAVDIGAFDLDGRIVQVVYDRKESLDCLESLRVRFGLAPRAVVRPVGVAMYLYPTYGDNPSVENRGSAGRERLYLYFHASSETIDYCVPGVIERGPNGYVFRCRPPSGHGGKALLEGPFLKRHVSSFNWDRWSTLRAIDADVAAEEERHARAMYALAARRATTLDGLPDYRAAHYNIATNAGDPHGQVQPKAGTLWTNNRDEIVAIVGRDWRFKHGSELLYPDGRRRWADLRVERWAPLPVWPQLGRAVVLERELYGRDRDEWNHPVIKGEGHFPGAGRHRNPWEFSVRLSSYEFAFRLAAALGWQPPVRYATGPDGEPVKEPDLHAGQWVRVFYRRKPRWALVVHCQTRTFREETDHVYLRDEENHLYYLTDDEVRALNPDLQAVFLAGPVTQGIPDRAVLTLHILEAPTAAAIDDLGERTPALIGTRGDRR